VFMRAKTVSGLATIVLLAFIQINAKAPAPSPTLTARAPTYGSTWKTILDDVSKLA